MSRLCDAHGSVVCDMGDGHHPGFSFVVQHPGFVLLVSLLAQWGAARLGDLAAGVRTRRNALERGDFTTVLDASLTLLALLIGFTLSMAVSRYDERRRFEEAESNVIYTQYLRASLGPGAAQMRDLLARYTETRIRFYQTADDGELARAEAETVAQQNALWTTVTNAAAANPTPISALLVSGAGDVVTAQGDTEGAWRNHIPAGARLLVLFVALACNFLLGYGEEHKNRSTLLILPFVVSISFFLISDIDSPRHGLIRMPPDNLIALAGTMMSRPAAAPAAQVPPSR